MTCQAISPWDTTCCRSPHDETVRPEGPTHIDKNGQTWRGWVGAPRLHLVGRVEDAPAWIAAQAAALAGRPESP